MAGNTKVLKRGEHSVESLMKLHYVSKGNTKVLRRGEHSVESLMKLHYVSKDTDGIDARRATRTISHSCIIKQRTREDEIRTTVNRTQIKN